MEQRLAAVKEVRDGATVADVARRYGVVRQTVHEWLRRYARRGLAGLIDRSSRPASCPHQMPPVVEARIVELRRAHPAGGHAPSVISWAATASSRCWGGVDLPVPGPPRPDRVDNLQPQQLRFGSGGDGAEHPRRRRRRPPHGSTIQRSRAALVRLAASPEAKH